MTLLVAIDARFVFTAKRLVHFGGKSLTQLGTGITLAACTVYMYPIKRRKLMLPMMCVPQLPPHPIPMVLGRTKRVPYTQCRR